MLWVLLFVAGFILVAAMWRLGRRRSATGDEALEEIPPRAPEVERSSKPSVGRRPGPAPLERRGGELTFRYRDDDGDVSVRSVVNWHEHGPYFTGFCLLRRAERTFRKERVLEWIDGTELLSSHAPPEPGVPRRSTPRATAPEILFSGFPAAARADLERRARASGFTVRSTVSQGLTCLVCGPNAGPSKIAAARAQGVEILSPEDCEALLETGELPA